MTNRTADISLRQAARVAGFVYLIFIFILGGFTNFIARRNLIVPGDAATTASNIMASESIFRMGLAGGVILLVADAVIAWALYIFLKPVNKSLSLLAAWFRLVFVAIFGSAFLNRSALDSAAPMSSCRCHSWEDVVKKGGRKK